MRRPRWMMALWDRRSAVERVPEIRAAWEQLHKLERILTAAQANSAQRIIRESGKRHG